MYIFLAWYTCQSEMRTSVFNSSNAGKIQQLRRMLVSAELALVD